MMTEAEKHERLHALLKYEAAKRAYEIARDAERAIYGSWEEAEELKREARLKMGKAEADLLGRGANYD